MDEFHVLNRFSQSTAGTESERRIESARDLDELARLAVAQLCAIYRCDAALLLNQPQAGEALCWAGSPSARSELTIPGLPARIDESNLAGRALTTGKTISVTEPGIGPNAPQNSSIAVPLKRKDSVLGVMQLSGVSLDVSNAAVVSKLEALADRFAAAIANLRVGSPTASPASVATSPRADREMNARLDLQNVYDSTYRAVCGLFKCDVFFIALYDDETKTGEFVLRIEQGVTLPSERFSLGEDMIAFVIRNRRGILVADVAQETRVEIRRSGGPHKARSLVCVPLIYGDRTIGALSAQSYLPNAYTEADLKTLRAFADQAALTIHNARLSAASQRKAEQLIVLNEVTRIVSSTIEINRLLDLICGEVRRILPADSYCIALVDEENRSLSVEVMVDEGERFPSTVVPLGENLASLVVRQRAPLRLGNVAEQSPSLGVKPSELGRPKSSASWLGVPMVTSEHLLGLLAVGSYQLGAFDESDQEVLQSVATQAAIAIDNARHHAEVEKQARHDSLTGALNHGHFLVRLGEEVERAGKNAAPLSLIMLDVDHFKEFNDSFGHLAGDAILRSTVQVILGIVESTDLVGRWGGEEFVIALPGCDKRSAAVVAERIRQSMAEVKLESDHRRAVPVPTVSQGIAAFPEDATSPIALVDRADICLYKAKSRGRDQISVAGES